MKIYAGMKVRFYTYLTSGLGEGGQLSLGKEIKVLTGQETGGRHSRCAHGGNKKNP
jgi:hypothetical protein